MYVTDDGRSGLAVKEDGDIVSVFSDGGGKTHSMLALAVQQGGTKLDAFDTVLPDIYAISGFKEVGRDAWNEEYMPEGWSKETFAKYNNGEPDVVYMEYDAAYDPFAEIDQADARADTGILNSRVAQDTQHRAAVESGDMETAQRLVDEAARAAGLLLHVTTTDNLASILNSGLRQSAPSDMADEAGVYLFRDRLSAEDALMNWLGDRMDDSAAEAYVFADPSGLPLSSDAAGFEVIVQSDIGADRVFSADPATYDDAGNLIPLSERFNPESDDIRNTRARQSKETRREPESPPRAGPPEVEGQRSAQERLERNYGRLEGLLELFENRQRVPLGEELVGQLNELVEGSISPTRVAELVEATRGATTHLQGRKLVRRTQEMLKSELQRRSINELQKTYRRAMKAKLRPEFLEGVKDLTEDIDFKSMSDGTRNALRATAKYLEDNPDAMLPDGLVAQLRRLNERNLRDMDHVEIQAITDAVKQAMHLSRLKNKLIGRKRGKERDAIAKAIMDDMERLPILKMRRSKGRDIGRKRSLLSLYLREGAARPEVLMAHYSETLRELVWEDIVVHAHHNENRLAWQFRDGIKDVINDAAKRHGVEANVMGKPKAVRFGGWAFENWRNETVTVETKSGPVEMTRDEAMWLRTTGLDPANRRIAISNGITLERMGRSVRKFQMDEDAFQRLENMLGGAEKEISDFMFRQFNGDMKDALNEAWVDVYGHEVARVPDYVPRSVDMDTVYGGKDPMEAMSMQVQATLTSWGNLKDRVNHPGRLKISSGMDVYSNHAEHVARISAYLGPAMNANSVLNRPDVKQFMKDRIGDEGYRRIVNSIKDQTVRHVDRNAVERYWRNRLRLLGASKLGMMISTILVQPTGLAVAAKYMTDGFKTLPVAAAKAIPDWSRVQTLGKKYSPYWRTRYDDYVHQISSGMSSEKARSYGPKDIPEKGLYPLQLSDQLGATTRWIMIEMDFDAHRPELEKGSDEYYTEVAREWERLMFRTENTGHGGDRTGLLAYGRESVAFSTVVQFTSSVTKIFTLAPQAQMEYERGEYRAGNRSVAALATAVLMSAVARETLAFLRGREEEDEEVWERVAKRMAVEFAGFFPIVGSAVFQPLVREMLGQGAWAFPASTAESTLRDAARTASSVYQTIEAALNDELDAQGEKVFGRKALRSLDNIANLVATWTGVPYYGTKDLIGIGRNITARISPDPEEQARENVNPQVERLDTSAPRNRMRRGVLLNNPADFERAIRDYHKQGVRVTPQFVRDNIRRMIDSHPDLRYDRQLRPYSEGWMELNEFDQEWIRRIEADRQRIREATEHLILNHIDLFSVVPEEPQ